MSINFGPGFHAAGQHAFNADAYEQYLGRWSRLFVPAVLNAAEVAAGDRVLDVATGPGEAALMALSLVGLEGLVIGADLSPSMLLAAKKRAVPELFVAVAADGQALPFSDSSFDAVICQLGLQFFPDPAQGVREFRRVVRSGRRAAVCVIATPDRTPMWGVLADVLGRCFPDQRDVLGLSFSLSDPDRLRRMFGAAGFQDVQVERTTRSGIVASFGDYWTSIEAGSGMMPQAYRALSLEDRRLVREEVQAHLANLLSERGIEMTFEMLIGTGRA